MKTNRFRNMFKFDLHYVLNALICTLIFGGLLLISGMGVKGSLSMGLILSVFYLALVRIQQRIRR